jgi:hypothetical protein
MYHEYATTAARVMTSPNSNAVVGELVRGGFDCTSAKV